tara:strand:- start:1426 stop:1668 length:243 start_codon:yes stop_codon:yes gene_type:complete
VQTEDFVVESIATRKIGASIMFDLMHKSPEAFNRKLVSQDLSIITDNVSYLLDVTATVEDDDFEISKYDLRLLYTFLNQT